MSSQTYTVTGMVLSAAPVGDYDKLVVLLTRERGKIRAFARGARRPGSALMAAANAFAFGEFQIYEGRTSYTMSQASIQNYFGELMTDFEGACYGQYFLEFADYYTRENADGSDFLKLAYQSLRALLVPSLPRKLVRYIYELKVLVVNGECPPDFGQLDICESTLYTLQYIAASSIEKLYIFNVSQQVLGELRFVLHRYRELYMEGHFKSLDVLETCVK